MLLKSRQFIKLISNIKLTQRYFAATSVTMAQDMNKFKFPKRYEGNDKSVWVEYIQLALDHKPLNLGQGFPDFAPPDYVTEALKSVCTSDNVLLHQYTRGFGHPRLVKAIATLYSQLVGREINSQTEVLVTAGAYEALYSSILGHIDEGDEAIIIEPYFDCYEPMVRTAGGVPRQNFLWLGMTEPNEVRDVMMR